MPVFCPLCLSHSKHIFNSQDIHGTSLNSKDTFSIYQCSNCLSVFPNIKISKDFYSKYYNQNYYSFSRNPITEILNNISFSIKIFLIRSLVTSSKIDLLDLGCGDGKFLNSIKQSSFNLTGIDINQTPSQGFNYINHDFLSYDFKDTQFNVITSWHVIEHSQQPQLFFQKIFQLLKPKSLFIFTIPNPSSVFFSYTQKYWYHLDSPRHLLLMPPKTVISQLQQAGFTHIHFINPFWEFPLDLFHSVRHSPLKFIVIPFYPIFKVFSSSTRLYIAHKP